MIVRVVVIYVFIPKIEFDELPGNPLLAKFDQNCIIFFDKYLFEKDGG